MSTTPNPSAVDVRPDSWSASASSPTAVRRWWQGRLGLPLLIEIALMGALFVGYRQVRYITRGDTSTAMDNAREVVRFERDIGLFTERAVQRIVMHSETLVHLLNRYYVTVHFPATIAFILWAFIRHQGAYRAIRAAFLIVTATGLALHVAYPLAPPRMLRAQGFVDTLRIYGPRIYSTDTTKSVANQFAAMPSLHFGWAVLVALGFMYLKRSRWSAVMLLHPFVTLIAIVATANHYWIDAGVAMVLVVMAVMVVARFVTGERPAREPVVVYQPLTPLMAGGSAFEVAGDGRGCERARSGRVTHDPRGGPAAEHWSAPAADTARAGGGHRPATSPAFARGGGGEPPGPDSAGVRPPG